MAERSGGGWRSEAGKVPVRDGARGAAVAGSRCRRGAGRDGAGTRCLREAGRDGWMDGGRSRCRRGPRGAALEVSRCWRDGWADVAGAGRSRARRSRLGWGRNFLRGRGLWGYGTQTLLSPLRAPSLRRCLRPSADGSGRRRPPCRWQGDDFGMRSGRRRRWGLKHLYSDSSWKCLFSRLDMDLKVIRLALRCCPAVKARSRSAERRGSR